MDVQIYKARFSGTVKLEDLEARYVDGRIPRRYRCLCKTSGHYMLTAPERLVAHCYHDKHKMWLVVHPEVRTVADYIEEAEWDFIRHMQRSDAVLERVLREKGDNSETRKYLWDTHGINGDEVSDYLLTTGNSAAT